MTDINGTALMHWRSDPMSFIETVLYNPETNQPYKLLPAQHEFVKHAFELDEHGRLLYPELVYAAPKKSGKTAFAALIILTVIVLYGGTYGEAYTLANDLDQSLARVFLAIRRIVEASPLLRNEARITADKIVFPAFAGAQISAIGGDYAGAAGSAANISNFDELWAYTSERSRRLWDEMIPPPTRKIACRLTTTYAGFEGESVLLEELYQRGLRQPQIGHNLYAGDGLLMFWSHEPVAPWQTEAWLAEMRRSLRPNQYLRMIENRFISSEFELHQRGRLGSLCSTWFQDGRHRQVSRCFCRRRRFGQTRQHRSRCRALGSSVAMLPSRGSQNLST